jgi:hypothetical protein
LMAKASVSLRQVSSDLESHDRLNEIKSMNKYAGCALSRRFRMPNK